MIKYTKHALLVLVVGLSACSDNGSSDDGDVNTIQYSITLTDVTLTKKSSGEKLTVNGLPARGATLTYE
jgi:hypothetical protein